MKTIEFDEFTRRIEHWFEEPDAKVVWFLGAGCSISSGVPGASQLVAEWLSRLRKRESGETGTMGLEEWATSRFERYSADRLGDIYADWQAYLAD